MQWHFYCGYVTAGLIVFRYFWAFVGPAPVRASSLLPRYQAIRSYLPTLLNRQPSGSPGHNPIGSLSVIAIVAVLTFQVATGLFAEDDGLFFEGPLASLVSSKTVRSMTSLHHLSAKLVIALVALHLGAILFYLLYKRENLITPMLTGWKLVRTNKDKKS